MTDPKTTLTAANVHNLAPYPDRKCPRLISDGNGLYLQVTPSGSRSYIFRYTLKKRTRAMGLGSVRTITLSEARRRARELRVQVDKGVDPLADRRVRTRDASASASASASGSGSGIAVHRRTFKRCADEYLEKRKKGWKSSKHAAQWASTLEQFAYPIIGHVPVADVGIEDVTKILEPIWSTINETASRLRGRIERILSWATVMKYRDGDNPARWDGCLREVLLPRAEVRDMNRHHNALPFAEAPAFMKALRAKGTMAAFLLEFLILTAVRTTEARAATWNEIDFDQQLWTVPEERMKTKVMHNVPLSAPAMRLLVRLRDIRNSLPDTERSNYVFPSPRPATCLSNMAMLSLLKKGMSRRDITPHGMRSTFRDYVSECTEFSSELAEAALAHKLRNKVEAAYRRGDLLQKRRVMMEAWAEYLASPTENLSV